MEEKEGSEIQGYVDYYQSKIVINNSLSQDAEEETIVHEILHVLLDRNNLEIISKNSSIKEVVENLVTYLAPRFHSFLKDNPEFLNEFLSNSR